MDGSDQVAVRQAKLDQMRENGSDPFRENWEQTHTSVDAKDLLPEDMEEGPEVSVAGRIVAFRLTGKSLPFSRFWTEKGKYSLMSGGMKLEKKNIKFLRNWIWEILLGFADLSFVLKPERLQ